MRRGPARLIARWRRLAALTLLCLPLAAAAQTPLIADLSDHLIAINAGFTGQAVLLFGAVDGPGDIAVVVRGPDQPVVVRRKENVGGLWVNGAAVVFNAVPSYYAIAASRPLPEFLSDAMRIRHRIGVDLLFDPAALAVANPTLSAGEIEIFQGALIRDRQRGGLYPAAAGAITLLGERLFRTEVVFPVTVPVGTYQVEVYLVRDGVVVGAQTTPLLISKVGIEATLFDLAHRRPALYGLIAVVLAAMAGWAAGAVFRRS